MWADDGLTLEKVSSEEAPQNINSNQTLERQSKQSNMLSLSRQNDCKTRNDTQ